MKAVVRYFSGTGNIRCIANVFASELQKRGCIVNCSSSEDAQELLLRALPTHTSG